MRTSPTTEASHESLPSETLGFCLGVVFASTSHHSRSDVAFGRRRRSRGRAPLARRAIDFFAVILGAVSVRATYPFQTKQQLLDDILQCLTAFPSGRGCCASGHCSHASGVEMPDWDVSGVTDMEGLFRADYYSQFSVALDQFNVDISRWDVSSVTNMAGMFMDATAFNQPLASWDVSNVTGMWEMFERATAFNQPLASWDVSSVTGMGSMFKGAAAFNQPLSEWDVSSVTDMSQMFKGAAAFDRDIRGWSTPSLTDSTDMFESATAWLATYPPPVAGSVDGPPSAWTTTRTAGGPNVNASSPTDGPRAPEPPPRVFVDDDTSGTPLRTPTLFAIAAASLAAASRTA